ncbi:MAG TPA: formylglycine-generating enzyme family protein [Opitutaceae bacterium]|nr:formylglycine-generating enzyme family protein [Opitutaceae bacterium]
MRRLCALLAALAALAARAAGPAPAATLELGGGVRMEFVLIPAGTFEMGSPENLGGDDESPRHAVTISRSFYLGKYEVTQEQWQAVTGANPSHFRGAGRPVESVSWNDCQKFLAQLAARTGRRFRLPTEAQWEYACRAGTDTPWSFGAQDERAGDYAWCGANSGGATHRVGAKRPNPWGLYDMHGNVAEWCADVYAKHTYDGGAATDPAGPARGPSMVCRGGAWGDDSDMLRCAYRNCDGPGGATAGIGLRCVMLP